MQPKRHGSCSCSTQQNLRFGVNYSEASRLCCFNRFFAEPKGYFLSTESSWLAEQSASKDAPQDYFDSVTGIRLFSAPKERSFEEFLDESTRYGWLSFRDAEVQWDHVRILPSGETVSITGTHLGHNLPDRFGNRYCINLVAVAGNYSAERTNDPALRRLEESEEDSGAGGSDNVQHWLVLCMVLPELLFTLLIAVKIKRYLAATKGW